MSSERLLSERSDRRVVADDARGQVIKTFVRRGGWRGLLEAIFGDRAARAMRAGRRALERGIAVAEPIELRGGALVMRQIAPARTAGELPRTRKNAIALAEFLRAIHDARLYPSDFHQGNVLFDAAERPHLIDYENLRAAWWISTRRRVRNLERLYRDFVRDPAVTRGLRMRFLLAYTRDRREAHALWRRIAERSTKKTAQYGL